MKRELPAAVARIRRERSLLREKKFPGATAIECLGQVE
jgi:hypothetical protein